MSILDDAEEIKVRVAYHAFLNNPQSCLLDFEQFKAMLNDYNDGHKDDDFWLFQRDWFREMQRKVV